MEPSLPSPRACNRLRPPVVSQHAVKVLRKFRPELVTLLLADDALGLALVQHVVDGVHQAAQGRAGHAPQHEGLRFEPHLQHRWRLLPRLPIHLGLQHTDVR